MNTTPAPSHRVAGSVYDSREAALADGWPDAEYGTWSVRPGSTEMVVGWIALTHSREDID